MRKSVIQSAVALAIAGAAPVLANAATYTIHISGASAQRTFWESDLEAIATGSYGSTADANSVAVCFLTKTNASLNPPVPDLHSLQCTISANRGGSAPALPSGVAVGDVINLNYEAEYGSVWGIAPFVAGSNAATTGRRSLVPISGGGTQTVSNYSRDLDTASTGLTAASAIDIGVSDMEPILWASGDNWPVSDGLSATPDGTGTNNVVNILSVPLQGQPTLAQLQAVEASWTEVNGEVFTVVVDNSANPTKSITNLSTQSLRAIFTGQYATWSQVPEVGTGAANSTLPIVVCRRDHGSGTQVAASLYFTQTECGGNSGTTYLGAASGTPPRFVSTANSALGSNTGNLSQSVSVFESTYAANPIENYSSNDIKACLAAYPGQSIGILSLSPGSAYTTISIDNVPANAHNAASGAYKFAVNTWAYNNTVNTQGSGTAANIASALILDAQLPSRGVLPAESGTLAGGVWTTTSPQVAYGIADINTAANQIQSWATNTASPSRPISNFKTVGKSACTIPLNVGKYNY